MAEDTLLRAVDAANASGVNVNTIRSWALRGKLAARAHDSKNHPMYRVEDILTVGRTIAAAEVERSAARSRRPQGRSVESERPRGRQSRRATVGYNAIHQRLKRDRGPASEQWCTDCGGPAMDWAYDHLDPDELMGKDGPYSLDLAHYRARCRRCHQAEDRAQTAPGVDGS
jgi:hypothetical protein